MKPARVVGRGPKGELILSGEFVFAMTDERGVPLADQMSALHAENVGFDVVGFWHAALAHGWKPAKIYAVLREAWIDNHGLAGWVQIEEELRRCGLVVRGG